ncbi:ribosome biogenesis regulatory protein [Dictyocaulus viviparus]|uniref:Ribosome biogenesis regulatory protein n=1 Tax=Dictyocaulus viviparus TaxID=29172 RepID=A0A0D8Y4T2_DICVI|nr:ribosome biogenesis regulatory protein [Dictyocaulus viviparus]
MAVQPADLKPTSVTKLVDPFVDLGHLVIVDRDEIEDDASENLLIRARNNAQCLFNKIWELERKKVEEAVVVELPKSKFILPREKKIPVAKEPTKWEKYAAKKGIKKKKANKKVEKLLYYIICVYALYTFKIFDETTKEWKPTYGYRRANDDTKDWLIEIPDGADPYKDYFAERVDKKKERIAKNETQRLKNIARQLGTKVRNGPSVDHGIGLGIPPEDKSKQQLRFAVDRAKAATASAGKFQRLVKGEKENVKTGKKRKFIPNEAGGEKQRLSEIWEKLKSKKAKINEEKVAAVAGPMKVERKQKKRNKPIRQKSQIHRQQWFKKKMLQNKKKRGNAKVK